MKRILKWVGIVLGAVILIIVAAGAYLYWQGERAFERTYTAPKDSITIPTGADAIARGKHQATIHICMDCHTADLRGQALLDDPNLGTFSSANLTSGKGGVGSTFTDKDWVNAIRYGIKPNGQSLFIMPSETYYKLNDQDLGDLIAYIKSVPPVDNTPPERRIGPAGRLLFATGQVEMAADLVAKQPARAAAVKPGLSVEYGAYLGATICAHCHGDNMAGMMWPKGTPDARLTPNLTPGGELLVWSQDDFVKALRTGEKPGGSKLDPDLMPWKDFSGMSDDELGALYAYLKSLPKTPSPSAS